jgi:hypothetical protein
LAASSRAPLPGENAVAFCHAEVVGLIRISSGNVSFDIGQMLFRFGDLPRQIANLPMNMALLISMNGAQLQENESKWLPV